MKSLSNAQTFTRRQTLGLFVIGTAGAAAAKAFAKTSNDHQSSQGVDNASLAILPSQNTQKPMIISF